MLCYAPVQDVERNSRLPLTAAGVCRLVAVAALLVVFLREASPRERPERRGPRHPALPHALPGEGRRGRRYRTGSPDGGVMRQGNQLKLESKEGMFSAPLSADSILGPDSCTTHYR